VGIPALEASPGPATGIISVHLETRKMMTNSYVETDGIDKKFAKWGVSEVSSDT